MSIFVQNFGFTTAPNYFPLSSKVTIKPAEQKPDDPPKPAKSLLMPNSVKKRLETKKVASKVDQKAPLVSVDQSDSDESDEEGGFFRRRFYRTYPLWYHKFGNMIIFPPGNLYSLCSPGNQHYPKVIYF